MRARISSTTRPPERPTFQRRISKHPILTFPERPIVEFSFQGEMFKGYEGEPIAAALAANGTRIYRYTEKLHRARGFFCAVGKCSACLMEVDDRPNVMVCMEALKAGMRIRRQEGRGHINPSAVPVSLPAPDFTTPTQTCPVAPESVELAIVGGGPAGLSAALTAARLGLSPLLIDDNPTLGGQLIKQTHKFFGSRSLYCGIRGIDIARILGTEVRQTETKALLGASCIGYFHDHILGIALSDRLIMLKARSLIFATGAGENTIAFPGCDLPGVMGAGAIQTMVNVHGVRPGRRVLMVGAGNIGLIVSYQLLQAGVDVACVVDVLPEISGYHVHAAKLVRLGVPILTRHTIVEVLGREEVEGAVIAQVDGRNRPINRTRQRLDVDTVCLAVGLSPLSELVRMTGCRMVYVRELGGLVAWHNEDMQTSIPGVLVAGDLSGIEEASTAMLEGRIAGAAAYEWLRSPSSDSRCLRDSAKAELSEIRKGQFGAKAHQGKEILRRLARN
ncbi:MAG: FAD-dependent oxidoreductase [candidate division WOR-3 bacterium]